MNKQKQVLQAVAGIVCMVVGGFLALYPARRYEEKRYSVDAAGCRMDLLMVSRADLLARPETGSVVVLHGISANKLIMQYLARAFAEEGLRVYVPDLPGHGRSPGPFTAEQAESCSASLLRGLAARGMIEPGRTILAGHSMGAAIALRIAEKFRPAGVIAISPAPMIAAHGVSSENLLFHSLPVLPPNTLIIAGKYETPWIVENARDLAEHNPTGPARFVQVPGNTHVSVLFSPAVARLGQQWAAQALGLPESAPPLPTRANLIGLVLGLGGLLLIAGPFLREMVGKERPNDAQAGHSVLWIRGALELALFCVVALQMLQYWKPLRLLHLLEGDYLASFFLIVGLGMILLHWKAALPGLQISGGLLGGAVAAGVLLHLLITGWFELTVSGTWLNAQRWERFPLFGLAAFLFLYAVELAAGPVEHRGKRLGFWFALMVVAWVGLGLGVLYLRSGEILLVLLAPYFLLFLILVGLGAQLVRKLSGSPTAAAVFSAILLAGFCLVLFPLS